jgi:hypothetical protein
MSRFSLLFTCLALSLLAGGVQAASWLECDGDSGKKLRWGGNSTTARINTGSFAPGAVLQTAQRGFTITNRNPSPFVINAVTETGGVGDGNGQNEVYASDISAPGLARMWFHCYWLFGWHHGLDEVDIILDSGLTWTTTQNKASLRNYGGTGRPIEPVIVHEAGHYLGLMHVTWEYNVMGDAWNHHHTNGSTTVSYFGEDASHGSRVLYGAQNSGFEDVSVSHWRRTGDDGEYSTHGRTRVRNSNDSGDRSSTLVNGEPRYRVSPGDSVRPEFTVENNGKNEQSNVTYGIYVSLDDFIDRGDRKIASGSFNTLHPADVWTGTIQVTIPDDLDEDRNYWLGMIIDDDNTVSEISGLNNAAYIGIRIVESRCGLGPELTLLLPILLGIRTWRRRGPSTGC